MATNLAWKSGMRFETIYVNQSKIACDGGPATGHPQVYLDLYKTGRATCPYCSREFIYQAKD